MELIYSFGVLPVCFTTTVVDESGSDDYGFYWSSTTHANSMSANYGSAAAYVSFGKSLGNMAIMEMPDMSKRNGQPGERPQGGPPQGGMQGPPPRR